MSHVYSLGPQTTGKVILITNYGNIDIELWTKEAPRACRNFIQLCLEGFYSHCIFHRIIKGFMIQTGLHGQSESDSIWGKDFMDEFHSRLRFNQRGIVAMANKNKPNSNGSQFFITLDKCSWLDKKHTIFGKVTGPTFFNALNIGELPTKNEYPFTDTLPMIVRVDVILNPFIDIVPRVSACSNDKIVIENNQRSEKLKNFNSNLNLLSFDEDFENVEGNDEKFNNRIKPIQQVIKNDPKLVKISENEKIKSNHNLPTENFGNEIDSVKLRIKSHREKNTQSGSDSESSSSDSDNSNEDDNIMRNITMNFGSEQLNFDLERKNEILQLKKDIIHIKNRIKNPNVNDEEENQNKPSALQKYQKQFLHLKKERSGSNTKHAQTIEKIKNFRSKLNSSKYDSNSWMSNKLKFHVDSQKAYAIDEYKDKKQNL